MGDFRGSRGSPVPWPKKGRGEHEEYPVGRGRLEPVGVPWTPNLWDLMSGVVEDAGCWTYFI